MKPFFPSFAEARTGLVPADRGMRAWTEGRLFLAATLLPLCLYVYLLAPGVTGEDSGELITAAATLGIAHPPGYPLWCLGGKVFATLVPIGSVAWRINLFSAVLGALAVGVLSLTARRLAGHSGVALTAALAFGASGDFLGQCVVAEVYTLNVLIFVGILELALRFDATRRTRWLYLLAFALGLGFTNHSTILPLVPVIVIWIVLRHPDLLRLPILWVNLPAALLLGLSIVLYLPIRSAADPALDWGDPETFSAALDHLLRRQYDSSALPRERTLASQLPLVVSFIGAFAAQLTPWIAALALGGALESRRRDRGVFLLLAILFGLTSYGFIWLLDHPGDRQSYHLSRVFFLPAYAIGALWAAVALGALRDAVVARTPERSRRRAVLGALAAVLLAASPLAFHLEANDRRDDRLAEDWGRNILLSLAPDAILLPTADHSTFPLLYLQTVEGLRPDVLIGNKYGVIEDRIFAEVFAAGATPRLPPPLGGTLREKERYLIEHSGRPVYLTIKSDASMPPGFELRPWGLVFEAVRRGTQPDPAEHDAIWRSFEFHWGSLERAPGNFTDDLILSDYHYAHARTALLFGRDEEALAALATAARYGAGIKEILNNLGGTLAEAGKPAAAIPYLEQSLAVDPRYDLALRNIANAWFALERYADGRQLFERAVTADPENAVAQLGLARAHRAERRIFSAYSAYRAALRLDPRNRALRSEINEFVRAEHPGSNDAAYLVDEEPPPLPSPEVVVEPVAPAAMPWHDRHETAGAAPPRAADGTGVGRSLGPGAGFGAPRR